jgi:hypothetical protein
MNRLSVESYRVATPPMCRSAAPKAGVRGHPWAMCCSLFGETLCPG